MYELVHCNAQNAFVRTSFATANESRKHLHQKGTFNFRIYIPTHLCDKEHKHSTNRANDRQNLNQVTGA